MTEKLTLTPTSHGVQAAPLLPARPPTRSERRYQLAKAFVQSGFFASLKGDLEVAMAKACVTILYAEELGLKPIAALTGINVIEGRPSLGANLIARRVRESGRYDYRVLARTDEVCHVEWLERQDDAPGGFVVRCQRQGCGHDEERTTASTSCAKCQGPVLARRLAKGWTHLGDTRWTVADAERAKLKGKDNWAKYGRAMLFARAITEGFRAFCPDVFGLDVVARDEDDEPAAPPQVDAWAVEGAAKTVAPEEDLPAPAPTRAKAPAAPAGGAA